MAGLSDERVDRSTVKNDSPTLTDMNVGPMRLPRHSGLLKIFVEHDPRGEIDRFGTQIDGVEIVGEGPDILHWGDKLIVERVHFLISGPVPPVRIERFISLRFAPGREGRGRSHDNDIP